MLDLLFWQYRDDNNCWDYVRGVLIRRYKVPESHVPKFGILPSEKSKMTIASEQVKGNFFLSDTPVDGAIACKYSGKYLDHVGVVVLGRVFHVQKSRCGVLNQSISEFSRNSKIQFYVHKSF